MTGLFELLWGWQAEAGERLFGGWPRGLTGGSSMTESVSTLVLRRRSARACAALTVLALALTACGGEADDPDTGTPMSTQSASTDASPMPSGSAGAGSSERPSGSSAASSEASGGEFVPASSEGPAQNVPVPKMPEAAKEQTQEGLEAALEYWWEADYYLKLTGDSAPMASVSTRNCVLCQDLLERWPELYELGGWGETSAPATIEVKVASIDPDGLGGTAILLVSETPGELYDPNGKQVQEASGLGSENTTWTASAIFSAETGNWQLESLSPER